MIRVSYFSYLIVFLGITILSACDNSLEDDKRYAEEKTIESYISAKKLSYSKSNGVYHIAVTSSYGYEVNSGDTVEFWFTGYTPKTSSSLIFDTNIKSVAISSMLDTNVRTFEPLRVIAGRANLVEGLKRGLLLTRLNQKSTIIFTSDIGFKGQIIGPLPAWSSLAYDIEVIYVNGIGIQAEKAKMEQVDLSGYTLHSSGMYYKYLQNPSGTYPSSTSTIYGWYSITLPNGTLVDEISTQNAEIDLTGDIISALKVGFTLLPEGGSAQLVAPSPMCYGKLGNDKVDPYQPLVISMRLDSIK